MHGATVKKKNPSVVTSKLWSTNKHYNSTHQRYLFLTAHIS